jgi:diaminopimelate epimerase
VKLSVMSATGNVFAVIDGFDQDLPEDPAQFAVRLCRPSAVDASRPRPPLPLGPPDLRLDGLLLLLPPRAGGACRMVIYNADGSRPESCGNGLRCIARLASEHGRARAERFVIETDCGPRAAELHRGGSGEIERVQVAMGVPRLVEREARLDTSQGRVTATLIELGNPHCVLFVADERQAPVETLGAELERHPRFPSRTNVEFVAARGTAAQVRSRLHMRVWERGVGETAACGTGACAATVAAVLTGRADAPLDALLPGGALRIGWSEGAEVLLSGSCEEVWSGEWCEPIAVRSARTVP